MPHLLGKGSARFGVASIYVSWPRSLHVSVLFSWRQKCLWRKFTQMVDRVVDSTQQLSLLVKAKCRNAAELLSSRIIEKCACA